MTDLVAFLNARLDEDEHTARAAMEYTDRDWTATVEPSPRYGVRAFLHGDGDPIGELDSFGKDPRPIVAHIARHDPARVLAEVAAKRKIVDTYATTIRIRDEAAARIRASGDNPTSTDLDEWDRAQMEASLLEEPVRLLAAAYAEVSSTATGEHHH